ncbi:MAG: enoyl-CoA hydratase-related protein [Pelovirga sp.]
MTDQPILTRSQDHIGYITLNRPQALNTFTPEFSDQLDQALWAMEKDDAVRVIVIEARGKHFSVGISLEEFRGKTPLEARRFLHRIDAFYHTLNRLNKPTIAAVQGYAVANGGGLSFACDMTIAADTAVFGTTAINVGLICLGPAVPLMRLVGRKKAMEMILTGETLTAAEAQRLGLVNRVVPENELQEQTRLLAEKLTAKSPLALRAGKEGLRRLQDVPYHQGLENMDDLFAALTTCSDAEEGIAAFLEKRQPQWQLR